jgi:hypothetical protein
MILIPGVLDENQAYVAYGPSFSFVSGSGPGGVSRARMCGNVIGGGFLLPAPRWSHQSNLVGLAVKVMSVLRISCSSVLSPGRRASL